jgi:hypothetical protein
MVDQQPPRDLNVVPAEIDRWNWGGFLLSWIWGIGNNTYIALLALIPLFGLIMPFVLGARGSRWAWRNGRWDSVDHFKRVQRAWAIWGAVIWLGAITMFGGLFGGTFYLLKHSEAYALGAARVEASAEVAALLGPPITTGIPSGSISTDGASGHASLSFSATGTKAAGRIFLLAVKKDGIWSLSQLALKVDGNDSLIDLLKDSQVERKDVQRRAG